MVASRALYSSCTGGISNAFLTILVDRKSIVDKQGSYLDSQKTEEMDP